MTVLRRVISEPLIQFFMIGLVLFFLSRGMATDKADPHEMVIDDQVYTRLAGIFEQSQERMPEENEMDEMVERFIINETLFREARALGLDHGDEMMRERLIQRMRQMIYSSLDVDPPDDETLEKWINSKPGRYDRPAIVSFRVIGLDTTEALARLEAENASRREVAGEPITPEGARMLSFIGRPRNQLIAAFEESFVSAIETSPLGEWAAVPSSRGWQVVKLLETQPAAQPKFEEIRNRASSDWRDNEIKRRARQTLDAMIDSYSVRREPYVSDRILKQVSVSAETSQ